MTVQMVSAGPTTVNQGAQNVSIVKINAWTTLTTVPWDALQINLIRGGSPSLQDSDITTVNVFKQNADSSLSQISYGTDTFKSDTANIILTNSQGGSPSPQSITPSTQTYFAVVSISSSATVNGTFQMNFPNASYFTVPMPPYNVAIANGGVFTSQSTAINQPPVTVNVSGVSLSTGSVNQGTHSVQMLKLVMNTSNYSAQLKGIGLSLFGTASGSDISMIRINNSNNQQINFTANPFMSSQYVFIDLTSSTQTLTTALTTFYVLLDVSDTAAPNDTIGINLQTAGYISLNGLNTVSSSGFPINSGLTTINAVINTVSVVPSLPTPTLSSVTQGDTNRVLGILNMSSNNLQVIWSKLNLSLTKSLGGSDTDISDIKIYRNAIGNAIVSSGTLIGAPVSFTNGKATIQMISPEPIYNPGLQTYQYLIVADISPTATVGAADYISVDTTSIVVNSPNIISNTPVVFPWSCTMFGITDMGHTLLVSGKNLAGGTLDQGQLNAPILQLGLHVNSYKETLSNITITKLGTLSDSLVTAVKIYSDTNDTGVINIQADPLIGSGVFVGGVASISIAPQVLTTTNQYYIISCDIDPNATVYATLGVQLSTTTCFNIAAPDSVSPQNLPLMSAIPTVRDVRTPTMPVVITSGIYTSHFQELNATWQSQVLGGRSLTAGMLSELQQAAWMPRTGLTTV